MEDLEKSERVSFYDWLRILATFYVVVGHSFYLNHETVYGSINYLQREGGVDIYNAPFYQNGLNVVAWIYGFHMPLFFFLSGAVLRLKPIEKLKVFILKKVKRLLIPYLMVGYLFMLPVKFLSGFYSLEGFEQALKVLWRGIDSGHLWFLTSLFWDTVIFATLYKILQKIHLEKIVLCLALVLQCTYHWIPKDILGLVNGLSMIFWFALGFEFESKRKNIKKYPIYFWIGLLSIGIVLDILFSQYVIVPGFVIIFVRGFSTCVLAYIVDSCLKSITRTRIYQFVVAHLFDIYLYHDPLEYLILFCFFKWGIVFLPGGEYLLIFTRIFGTAILSVMIGWGIEKLVKRKGKRYEK